MRSVAIAAVALMFSIQTADAFARHCPCVCGGQVVTQSAPIPEQAPPTAPQQGQTAQSRSVEPQAAPTVVSSPAPVMYYSQGTAGTHTHSRYRDIEMRRLHPSNHFASMR